MNYIQCVTACSLEKLNLTVKFIGVCVFVYVENTMHVTVRLYFTGVFCKKIC